MLVSADDADSDTLAPGTLYSSFFHDGRSRDLIQYGFTDSVTVHINDEFFARYGEALTSGTAQGGSLTGITFANGYSRVSGFYNEYFVRIAGGKGNLGETRQVAGYDGAIPDSARLAALDRGARQHDAVRGAGRRACRLRARRRRRLDRITSTYPGKPRRAARSRLSRESSAVYWRMATSHPAPPPFSVPVLIVGDKLLGQRSSADCDSPAE